MKGLFCAMGNFISYRTKKSPVDRTAAERAKRAGAESLYAVMTHMIPGREYQKAVEQLEKCRKEFQEIYAASPVLGREEDCGALIPVLREILGLEESREYILMGHGTDDAANIRYVQMNEAVENAGLPRLRIASVESRPDLEDAMRALAQKREKGKVLVHPFLVVAGDHARNDMAGTDDSYVTRLQEAGYEVEAVVKGLGEYAQFRKIYADRLMEMLQNGSGRMEEEA